MFKLELSKTNDNLILNQVDKSDKCLILYKND